MTIFWCKTMYRPACHLCLTFPLTKRYTEIPRNSCWDQ